ncbi:MAG: Ig-like domain-containing protein [Pseudomonadota bacterium]
MTRHIAWTLMLGTSLVSLSCDDRPFVTAVDLPLQVIALTPGHQATRVGRDSTVTAVFNLDLVPTSVENSANFYLEALPEGEAPLRIEATIVYQGASGDTAPRAVLTPAVLLDYSRRYRVTLGTGIQRQADEDQNLPAGQLPVQVQAVFTTEDPPPLLLVSAQPGAGVVGVARAAQLTLTFSEPLNCDSLEAGVQVLEQFDGHPHTSAADRSVPGQWDCREPADPEDSSCENGQCSAVFTPGQAFAYSSTLRVRLSGGRRDDGAIESFRATASGGQLPASIEVAFVVEHPDPLALIALSPGPDTEQVPLDAVIAAGFSEALECGTVNLDTVHVAMLRDPLRGGDRIDLTGTISCSGDEMLGFEADIDFDWSAQIELTLAGGAFVASSYPGDAIESARATSQGGQLADDVVMRFWALDPPALSVLSTTPGAGAQDVAVDSHVTVVFSEAIACDSVQAAVSDTSLHVTELADDGSAILHTVDLVSCAGATLELDGVPDYSLSGVVTWTLPATLASLRATSRGGHLDGGYSFSFRAQDPPPLRVLSTNPAAGAEGVSLDANITLTFSEPVNCATVQAAISDTTLHLAEVDDQGGSVAHTLALLSCSDATVVLDPAPSFTLSGLVTVTVPATLASLRQTSHGGTLEGGVVFGFRAADPPPLLVTSTFPGGGATTADLGTDLVVTFSEAIDCSTVEVAGIIIQETLDDGSIDSGHSVTITACSAAVLRLDLARDLQLSSTVVVSLPEAIRSARATSRGGSLAGGYTWVFGTANPPALLVVYTSPGDGNILVPVDKVIQIRFSEGLDPATVNETSVVIEDVTDAMAVVRLCDSAAGRTCQYALSDGDTTITVTPASDFAFDHRIRFTLTSALASARSTSQGGFLGLDLVYTFETTPVPPIEVVSLVPPPGSASIPLRPLISVEFNQDVLGSTVVVGGSPADLTVWLNPGTAPNAGGAVALTCTGCASTGTSFSFQPSVDLVAGSTYVFAIKGNINGIRGASGGAFMVDDYLASYSTSTGTLVSFASPADMETAVAVQRPVCVIFVEDIEPTSIDSDSFAVAFVNDLGGPSPLLPDLGSTPAGYLFDGVDPATGQPDSGYSSNRVCFVPGPALYGCRAIEELLPAGAEIQVHLSDDVISTGGTALTGGYSLRFFTGGLEHLVAFAHRNTVGGSGALEGAQEIPVNASFVLQFSAPVQASSVDAALQLVRLDSGADIPLAPATLEAGDTVAVVQASALMPYLGTLPEGLELRVTGGAEGVRMADGLYLDAHRSARFFTSPATTVALSPPQGENAYQGMTTPAMFSRPMYLPSLNTGSFFAVDNTDVVALTAIVATAIDDVDSAVLVPVPAYVLGHAIEVTVTSDARDYLGNPLPQDFSVSYGAIQSGAQQTSYLPDPLNAGSVSPTQGATVAGDQVFTLTFSSNMARLKNRMLATSLNNASLRMRETACPGGGERGVLNQSNRFLLGTPGQPDRLQFWADDLLRHGCSYEIRLVQSEFANVYAFSDGGFSDILVTVTAESTAPTLASTVPAAGATNVAADAALVAQFSEAMDPATFDAATSFVLSDGAPVSGQVVVSGSSARFEPDHALLGGVSYTWTLGNTLTDLAGNAFAGATRTFTVEAIAPQVQTISIPALDSLRVTFDEAMDPATLLADVVGSDGSIQVRAQTGGATVWGCWELDASGSAALFTPLELLSPGASYQVTVTTTLTDLGGTAIAAPVVQVVVAP